jgi:hypothetical protein
VASSISIKAGAWSAIRPEETDSLFVGEEEIVPRRASNSSIGLWGEEDVEFMHSRLKIQGPFCVPIILLSFVCFHSSKKRVLETLWKDFENLPSSIRKSPQNSRIRAIIKLLPLRSIKCNRRSNTTNRVSIFISSIA